MPSIDPSLQRLNTLLPQLEGGTLNEELTEMMQRCIREIADACHDRGGKHKASLTLRLDFEMDQKDKVVEISAVINEKLPKAPRGRAGMYFADENGNLLRENPRQLTLDDELKKRRESRADAS